MKPARQRKHKCCWHRIECRWHKLLGVSAAYCVAHGHDCTYPKAKRLDYCCRCGRTRYTHVAITVQTCTGKTGLTAHSRAGRPKEKVK